MAMINPVILKVLFAFRWLFVMLILYTYESDKQRMSDNLFLHWILLFTMLITKILKKSNN